MKLIFVPGAFMSEQVTDTKKEQLACQYARAKTILFWHFVAFLIFEFILIILTCVLPNWSQQLEYSFIATILIWPIGFAVHWLYVHRILLNRLDKQQSGFKAAEQASQTETREKYVVWHMLVFAIFIFPVQVATAAIMKSANLGNPGWLLFIWPLAVLIHILTYMSDAHTRNANLPTEQTSSAPVADPAPVVPDMTAAHINLPDPFPILDPLVDPPRPRPAPPVTEPAFSRYEFTQTEFKKGGMATISLARDRKNQSMPVIIKTPRHDTEHSVKLNVEKLLQEADYLRTANHPNIVKFIDLFYDQEKMPNLVVEYIDCGDLLSKFKTAPVDEQSTVKWGVQILSALEYIHQSGFIHRDLNPGNIMVRGSGEIALIDFGTVKSSGYSSDTVFFKPGFVIPEVSAKGYADKRSDIYGVGSTLYYLLTCDRPGFIKERDVVSMLTEKGISQRTAKCIDQALQMDPNFRFQTAVAMRRALTGG
jgi:tRNA A-37 threonylcarbamoyl transferase component Bud32